MTTQLHDDTTAHSPKAYTIRLHFDETPEDQALYAALRASSDREHRTPLSRQVKHLLKIAIHIEPRIAKLEEAIRGDSSANAAVASVPPPPTRPATILRLIPGGAEVVKSADNNDGLVT